MKSSLRILALGAALSVTLLSSTQGASFGTCRTLCTGGGTLSSVVVTTDAATCCSSSYNPCPPGTTKGASTFAPSGGFAMFCRPFQS